MILVDTSAWVEYFRATESTADRYLSKLIDDDADIAVTEPVLMEVLAGARTDAEAQQLRQELLSVHFFSVGLPDYEAAASIHRLCRRGGETVRSHVDCLVAALAIRTDSSLLHIDADFDVIARHTTLRVEDLP